MQHFADQSDSLMVFHEEMELNNNQCTLLKPPVGKSACRESQNVDLLPKNGHCPQNEELSDYHGCNGRLQNNGFDSQNSPNVAYQTGQVGVPAHKNPNMASPANQKPTASVTNGCTGGKTSDGNRTREPGLALIMFSGLDSEDEE